jgi:hypothetical protein
VVEVEGVEADEPGAVAVDFAGVEDVPWEHW